MKKNRTTCLPKKYFLVFIILVLAFMTGRNYDTRSDQERQISSQLIALQAEQNSNQASLLSNRSSVEFVGTVDFNKNDFYRLFFDVKTLKTEEETDLSSKSANVKVFLSSNYPERQLIGNLPIKNDQSTNNIEILFQSNNNYSNLYFKKDSIDFNREINFLHFHYVKLNVNTIDDMKKLKPSIAGNLGERVAYMDDYPLDAEYIVRGREQLIGRVFEASTDFISSVDLKLRFVGGGGFGNYSLEIRKIDDGSTPKLYNTIAKYNFSQETAQNLLKIGPSTYHFPICAKLKKGDRYFIGINNYQVKPNYFNTIMLLGTSNDGIVGNRSLVFHNLSDPRQISNIYLKLFEPQINESSNRRILKGEIIQDLGSGKGLYNYDQTEDALDIYQEDNRTTETVSYDNSYNGIVAQAEGDIDFVYKFDSGVPIERAIINLSGIQQGTVKPLISYSLDNISWIQIPSIVDNFNDTEKFTKIVNVNDQYSTIYLKATYDPSDYPYKPIKLFGIQQLSVQMDLNYY